MQKVLRLCRAKYETQASFIRRLCFEHGISKQAWTLREIYRKKTPMGL